MMVSPNYYAAEHKNDSFEELIEERNRLIEEMNTLKKIAYAEERKDSTRAGYAVSDDAGLIKPQFFE